MTRSLAIVLLILTLATAPAVAAPASARPATRTAPTTAHRNPAKPHAAAGATADSAAVAPGKASARTLEDIHIEGEIPVPQVLFITARDQRRFMEFQHHRYLKTSVELGRATATPSRVVVTAPAPVERKENQR
jgi:hypothetical protein